MHIHIDYYTYWPEREREKFIKATLTIRIE